MSIQNGKKPLSQKPNRVAPTSFDETLFGDRLALPSDLRKELEEQGLAWKFISVPKLKENGGWHERGWRPYKRKGHDTMSPSSLSFGADPDSGLDMTIHEGYDEE
jgi:hypothetical protein